MRQGRCSWCAQQPKKRPPLRAASLRFALAFLYFFTLLATLRAASFTSPAALCTSPLALSALPSSCISLSPLTLPAPSLMAPLVFSANPFTCSRSIAHSFSSCEEVNVRRLSAFRLNFPCPCYKVTRGTSVPLAPSGGFFLASRCPTLLRPDNALWN